MELTKNQIDITKGIAILFMLLLHLFCTKDYVGLFSPMIMIGEVPLIYYIALFGDMCVAIYCFCSGYGLMIGYKNNRSNYTKRNLIRIFKLYINFWIILFIFILIMGPMMGKASIYPGDFKKFLLTFTAINPAYNGAWWFLTTYIILVLLSPYINKIVIRYNCVFILIISFIIYIISYIQRVTAPVISNSEFINYILRQIALVGTSQLPYIIGAIFEHKRIYSKMYNLFSRIRIKNLVAVSLIVAIIIAHGYIQTLFVAVFTGVSFIVLFNVIDKPIWLNNVLSYISKHSTNMWLTHMFFYMIFFKELVFAPKYPILIFIWLVIICIIVSHIINIIYNPIIKIVDKKLNKKQIA